MRLAIPSDTADSALSDIAKDPSTHYENHGDRMQACVIKFAKLYGVSPYVAKERLRQLGYDNVDGTIIEFDGDKKKPFTFPRGTLNENETFVINRVNYERPLRENKDFAELINSGRYVYLGYVVCLFDNKYINIEENGESIEPILSEYARENAQKCLLKFRFRNKYASNQSYYYSASYLNKNLDYIEIEHESFELCEDDTGLDDLTLSEIKEYNNNFNELKSDDCSIFTNTLIFHMNRLETSQSLLAELSGNSPTTIYNYCHGIENKDHPKDEKQVLSLCVGLQLEPEYCLDFFEKAGFPLEGDTPMNRACKFMFKYTKKGLAFCNKVLRVFKQEEIKVYTKKNIN